MMQEAVKELFRELESIARPDLILATSSVLYPLQCLVLSLGEGDETALKSRRRTYKSTTPQRGGAKAPQCTKGARSRYWPGNGDRVSHPRARRSARAAESDRRDSSRDTYLT